MLFRAILLYLFTMNFLSASDVVVHEDPKMQIRQPRIQFPAHFSCRPPGSSVKPIPFRPALVVRNLMFALPREENTSKNHKIIRRAVASLRFSAPVVAKLFLRLRKEGQCVENFVKIYTLLLASGYQKIQISQAWKTLPRSERSMTYLEVLAHFSKDPLYSVCAYQILSKEDKTIEDLSTVAHILESCESHVKNTNPAQFLLYGFRELPEHLRTLEYLEALQPVAFYSGSVVYHFNQLLPEEQTLASLQNLVKRRKKLMKIRAERRAQIDDCDYF